MAVKSPGGLGPGGRALWRSIAGVHALDAIQKVTLLEACRAKDRLDKLDEMARDESDTWATLTQDYELKMGRVPAGVNSTATLLKQLLASLRLPDAAGRRPQRRGGARGAYLVGKRSTGYWTSTPT